MFDALSKNREFYESPLYIFADAARTESEAQEVARARAVAKSLNHPNMELVERESNLGLSKSVIDGVTSVCRTHGKVIVIEDDLIVSDRFLEFMNRSLEKFEHTEKIMQVSGYMFPIADSQDVCACLLPISSTWGWATWWRSWEKFVNADWSDGSFLSDRATRHKFDLGGAYPYGRMFRQKISRRIDSWGILWYACLFKNRGLVLYPSHSLVFNAGFDGSGTHCTVRTSEGDGANISTDTIFPGAIDIDYQKFSRIREYLSSKYSFFPRAVDNVRTFLVKKIIKKWSLQHGSAP